MPSITAFWRNGNAYQIDFSRINAAALPRLPRLVEAWLPGGRHRGGEYLALNPHRADRHLGSFSVNTRTGRWGDFATGDKGGDVVSLVAFIHRTSQADAAKILAVMLGVEWRVR